MKHSVFWKALYEYSFSLFPFSSALFCSQQCGISLSFYLPSALHPSLHPFIKAWPSTQCFRTPPFQPQPQSTSVWIDLAFKTMVSVFRWDIVFGGKTVCLTINPFQGRDLFWGKFLWACFVQKIWWQPQNRTRFQNQLNTMCFLFLVQNRFFIDVNCAFIRVPSSVA